LSSHPGRSRRTAQSHLACRFVGMSSFPLMPRWPWCATRAIPSFLSPSSNYITVVCLGNILYKKVYSTCSRKRICTTQNSSSLGFQRLPFSKLKPSSQSDKLPQGQLVLVVKITPYQFHLTSLKWPLSRRARMLVWRMINTRSPRDPRPPTVRYPPLNHVMAQEYKRNTNKLTHYPVVSRNEIGQKGNSMTIC
jgi:hypothetical protein